jgi:hypothetical protein
MEMFKSNLNNFHMSVKLSDNKRNQYDFHRGGAMRKDETREPRFMSSSPFHAQSFSLGVSLKTIMYVIQIHSLWCIGTH